jgi:hypothetical protein
VTKTRRRVRFHRGRAVAWAALGALSFLFGWQESVMLVWIASVYANVVSDWTAGEAADDREICDRLDRIEAQLDALLERQTAPRR